MSEEYEEPEDREVEIKKHIGDLAFRALDGEDVGHQLEEAQIALDGLYKRDGDPL